MTALAVASALSVCAPIRCEWAAPGFSPSSQVSEVWSLPCQSLTAAAPLVPGDYPVTLTVRCAMAPTRYTTQTKLVTVYPQGFRDGFESGDTSRWTWRWPT